MTDSNVQSMPSRKRLSLNKSGKRQQRKSVGHEAILDEILATTKKIDIKFENDGEATLELVGYDKFALIVLDKEGEKTVIFKHAVFGFRKAEA